MKKRILQTAIIVLFLVFNVSVTAQEDFIPGFIINNNLDKLRGFINYKNWETDKIAFKRNEASEIVYFYPKEIKNFQIGDKIFISAIVDVWASQKNKVADLKSHMIDLKLVTDTVFLETLFEGGASLYQYNNKDGISHFYIGFKNNIKLLYSEMDAMNPNENNDKHSGVEKKKDYKEQLLTYFKDCPSLKKDIKTTEYNSYDLISLFKKYRTCSNENYAFIKDVEESGVDFGPVIGVTSTKIGFSTSTTTSAGNIAKTDFPASINPTFGLFLNFKVSKKLGSLSIHNELLYSTFKTKATYLEIRDVNYTINNTWDLGLSQAKLNTMLRYRYRVNKSFIYANAGFSFAINLSEVNTLVQEITFYNTQRIVNTEAIKGTENTEVGYFIGVGAQSKSFSLEARCELSDQGIANLTYLKSSIFRAHILVSYKIK